jgi:hypothetical protein
MHREFTTHGMPQNYDLLQLMMITICRQISCHIGIGKRIAVKTTPVIAQVDKVHLKIVCPLLTYGAPVVRHAQKAM